MAANQASVNARPADLAMDIVARMESLADSGEWSRIEQLAARLRNVLLEIPIDERQAAIVSIGHCLERLQIKVLVSRGEVAEKLSEIRRGQVATRAYGQPERRAPDSPLR
ncbi:MAG TPA: hypothetical protein PKH39_10580 [Woeseiaceae bacterium]|nr:hypothetical protein [Woeseiaceae bacterium]